MTGVSLARRLRAETTQAHRLAEASRLAKAFFRGRLNAEAYALGLARIEPVYAALEEALSAPERHPLLAAFHRPEIFRLPAIREDLARLGPAPRPRRSRYAERIREVAAHRPVATLGHFYVRYFGDLAGVARLAPLAPRLLGLPADARLAFFRFPGVRDRKATLAELRAYLDALPLACHDDVIAEARRSFALHGRLVAELFDELEGRPRETSALRRTASS
ncbi:MAG TPA: biliverdin-producing heme oxygenase [Sandaracinaceae bacterium LLY-WYZ-13_1]|nr:biliverdin-producing heme oxygenase [Sandaracinaceae bacterium LLY-WYZ-13_1]